MRKHLALHIRVSEGNVKGIQQEVPISDVDTTQPGFAKVEKESEFPGGREAWRNFLINKNPHDGYLPAIGKKGEVI